MSAHKLVPSAHQHLIFAAKLPSPRTREHLLLRRLLVRQDVACILGARRIDSFAAFFDMLDDSVLVDHEGGAIAVPALFVEDAVVLHDRSFEITQQGKGQAILFGKLAISGNAVNANAENLSIGSIEFGDISLIRLHLFRSTTGERQDIKRQHDILLAFEVAELVCLAVGSPQGKVRSRLPNLQIGMRSLWGCSGRSRSLRWSWLRSGD